MQTLKVMVTRTVTRSECPWLPRAYHPGEFLFYYQGHTYGCISANGVAVSEKENETPFFELPAEAVQQCSD